MLLRHDGTLARWARVLLLAAIAGGLYVAATTDPLSTFFFLTYAVVGGLLVVRRPNNLVSWLLVGIGFTFIGTSSPPALDLAGLKNGTAPASDELWVWVSSRSSAGIFVLFTALAATFPTGRLPEGRWRMPILAGLAPGASVVVLSMISPRLSASTNGGGGILVPNPIGLIPDFPGFQDLRLPFYVVVLGAFGLAISSMLARYRGASETTRLQLLWLLAAISFVLLGVLTGLSLGILFPALGGTVWIPAIVAYPTVPVGIGIAILRYRLYEIDRVINRALVYAAVTAILAGVFAAVTLLTQRIFVALTGQRSDAAIVLTTLAVATLYAPVRRRVEVVVDRYFKYDQRLFGAYRDELRRTLDVLTPARAAYRLAREAQVETGALGVAVTSSDGVVLASVGEWPAEPSTAILINSYEAPLSAVLLGPRPDGRPHRPQAVAALEDVAAMAALASTAIRSDAHGALVAQPER
jgi:hypothetical protein